MFRFCISLFPLLVALATISADDKPEKKDILRWFGQSFFQLETSSGQKIVFDPHAIAAFGRPILTGDIVLISHPHNDHNQIESLDPVPKSADIYYGVTEPKPGKQEWKVVDEKRGQIRLRTLATFHDAKDGMLRGKNTVWIVEADGLVYCHLGDLGHELTEGQLKALGKVDVLMIPVGGVYTLNGEQARKVVDQIKPSRFVVPMHYGVPGYDDLLPPDEFFEGIKPKKLLDTNELVIPLGTAAPAEPTFVQLGWKKAEPSKKP